MRYAVGLTSLWPCVTDNSGITTYWLMAIGREMSTLSKLQYRSMAHFTFLYHEAVLSHTVVNV